MIKQYIESNDFYELIAESDIKVDKTLFIKEMIDSDYKAMLITRPRRWGKSMNLDMLKKFLSIEVDENGDRLKTNPYRILFEGGVIETGRGGKKNLDKLKIAKIEGNYMHEQGNSPVILFSFKDCMGNNINEAIESIKLNIIRLFKSFSYLLKSDHIRDYDKELFIKYIKKEVNNEYIKDSLSFLSQLLYQHFKKKVWLLVDEHDKPASHFLTLNDNNKKSNDITELTSFIKNLMSRCGKSNHNIYKTLITGVTDVTSRESDSGFNNLEVFNIQNLVFSESFGLSEEDVKLLIKQNLDVKYHEKVFSSMKEWYDGYALKDMKKNQYSKFNVWSVIKYISELSRYNSFFKPKAYFSKTGIPTILNNINKLGTSKKFIEELNKISRGDNDIKVDIPDENYDLISNIDNIEGREEFILYLLVQHGYLNIVGNSVRIPNLEVYINVRKDIIPIWAKNTIKDILGNNYSLEDYGRELNLNLSQEKEFSKILSSLVQKVKEGTKNESYFNSVIGGIIEAYALAHKSAIYEVLFEKKVGVKYWGRSDNIFYPSELYKHNNYPVIIHEYKKINNITGEENIIIENALWQIIEKQYLKEPILKIQVHKEHYNFDTIIIRAILFIQNENTGKWSIQIKEKSLSIKTAKNIVKFINNKELKNNLKTNKKYNQKNIDIIKNYIYEKFKIDNIDNFIKLFESEDFKKHELK